VGLITETPLGKVVEAEEKPRGERRRATKAQTWGMVFLE
jgi:hypothetical protein